MAGIRMRVAGVTVLALLPGACAGTGTAPPPPERPNVVLFLIDDLG